jgi:hypothetical protein
MLGGRRLPRQIGLCFGSSLRVRPRMLFIRRVLQLIFGLLLAAVLYSHWKSPNPNYESTIGLSGIALLVILVLGPFWPSANKIERAKAILDRVTGLPNATPVVVNVLGGLFALYEAWDSYAHSPREALRIERTIATLFGSGAVPVAWLFLAAGCAWYAYRFYRKSKGLQS